MNDHAGKVFDILCLAQKFEWAKVEISWTSKATLGKWQNMKHRIIAGKNMEQLA